MLKWVDSLMGQSLAAVGIAAVCSVLVAAAGQEPLSNSAVLAAARAGTVEQFAAALVQANTPVGLVLLEKDVHAKQNRLPFEPPGEAMELEVALRAFEARHPAYRAERTAFDGAVIAPRASGWCTQPLRSRLQSLTTSGQAFEVLDRIYRVWTEDRSPYVPPGVVGSTALRPDTYRTLVAVSVFDSSLEAALNATVQQAPGLGWAVREVRLGPGRAQGGISSGEKLGCNLVLFDSRSWLNTSLTFMVTAAGR